MNPEVLAEWLRRQGHRVVRTESSYWFDQGPRVFQAIPYHWVIEPTERELLDFMKREKAIGLRYSAPLHATEGACSYHIVYEHPTYDLGNVHASTRSTVRRGLDACRVGPIPFERYAREGWTIEKDTQDRQQRKSRRGQAKWERMMEAASSLEGFEVWGAEVEGRLAATLMFVRIDDCATLLFQQSHRDFLHLRVNNALLYTVTQALAQRPGLQLIHNGLHSLDAPPSVDEFKIRMGYEARPVRQRVMFNPRIDPFVGAATEHALNRLVDLLPKSEFVRKAEGLARFCGNGKRPLPLQPLPRILESRREAIYLAAGVPLHPAPIASFFVHGQEFRIVPATLEDVDALVALHLACFSGEDHIVVRFGKPFVRAVHRWLVSTPGNTVLAAKQGEALVGFTTISDRPYNLPMLRACKWQLLKGLLRRPWLVAHPLWLWRLASQMFSRPARESSPRVAQIGFTAVAPALQRHGIGKALKRASLQLCRDRGMEAVITGVLRRNTRAWRLNEQFGFLEVPQASSKRLVSLRLDLTTNSRQTVGGK